MNKVTSRVVARINGATIIIIAYTRSVLATSRGIATIDCTFIVVITTDIIKYTAGIDITSSNLAQVSSGTSHIFVLTAKSFVARIYCASIAVIADKIRS